MSGTYPADPVPQDLAVRSVQPTDVSVAHNLRKIRQSRGVQRWSLEFFYPPLTRDKLAILHAFAMAQRGQLEAFDVTLPIVGTGRSAYTASSVTVHTTAAAGDSAIVTTGWPSSVSGVVRAGDMLTFANHTKVYLVTADAHSSGGVATIAIVPQLIEPVAGGTSVKRESVSMRCTLTHDDLEYTIMPGGNDAPRWHVQPVQMVETV